MKKIEKLFENEYVVVINKPAGTLVHDDGSGEGNTVVDWVRNEYPDIVEVGESVRVRTGEEVQKPGIVHRLDRDTTGVLMIAKTQESYEHLKKQFQEHRIEKTYHAFVYGHAVEDEGEIDKPIGKSTQDFRKYSAQRGARGKMRDAYTSYTVLERGNDVMFFEFLPKTGRTHQIRVHAKAIHHPIVCDTLYAPNHPCLLGFERMALHARAISFEDLEGNKVKVEAPYPTDFEQALLLLKK